MRSMKWYASHHLGGGFANSGRTAAECNAEFFKMSGGARRDVPEMTNAPGVRIFLRATRKIEDKEEILVWYGKTYIRNLL